MLLASSHRIASHRIASHRIADNYTLIYFSNLFFHSYNLKKIHLISKILNMNFYIIIYAMMYNFLSSMKIKILVYLQYKKIITMAIYYYFNNYISTKGISYMFI